MIMITDYLQHVLNKEIPITQALQIKVNRWQDQQLVLDFPLTPNINHMSSAFGGSLYCGAVLAGWGWMHLQLKELGITNAHIVIQNGQISYPLPVLGNATIICYPPDIGIWEKFKKTFKRYSKGRLELKSVVLYENKESVIFNGQFVVYYE